VRAQDAVAGTSKGYPLFPNTSYGLGSIDRNNYQERILKVSSAPYKQECFEAQVNAS